MPNIAIVNGDIQPEKEARIPVLDRGFLFGDSVYEVIRTREGVPYQVEPHLRRLRASAEQIRMELDLGPGEIRRWMRRGMTEAGHGETYIRIVVSRGSGPSDINPRLAEKRTWVMLFRELRTPTPRQYAEGIGAAIPRTCRNDPGALNPAIKSGNYLNNILALLEAQEKGAEEALILNKEGYLTEATTANAFIVEGERIYTPPLAGGILEGITRAFLLEMAERDGCPVKEEHISLNRLQGAREIFITSTTKDILPITRLDGEPLGEGRPGPVTRDLMERMEGWAAERLRHDRESWES